MQPAATLSDIVNDKFALKIAIVGGGRDCRTFLDYLRKEPLPYVDIRIAAVCDLDPQAEGLRLARRMGIATTTNFHDLLKIKGVTGIIELTHGQALPSLIPMLSGNVALIEHNTGRILRDLFLSARKLKSAEQQVLMERMVSSFLIQQARQRIVVLNTDFSIAEVNDAYLKGSAKTREEIVGARCYTVLHGLDAPCSSAQNGFECPMLETLRTGESAHIIHEDPLTAEQPSFCEIVTYPVCNRQGRIVQVIEIWRDITDALTRRMEARMQALRSDLNQLVQEDRLISLGKLVASCVHEINNPIQGMLTFSYLLRDVLGQKTLSTEDIAQMQDYVALIVAELERCGEMVSGLLSFARETPKTRGIVDLNDILQSAVSLTHNKIKLQEITLELNLLNSPLFINGDKNRLQQCFLNLIFNALEAMSAGGRLAIASFLEPDGRSAYIQIEDTGYGIAKENLDHLFDPFFTTKAPGEGTGLGLSIVYGVVKNHGGHIEVQSRLNRGTAFVLHFPLPETDPDEG